MKLFYRDPEKKKIQAVQLIALLLLFPTGLYSGYQAYSDWTSFRKAETIYLEGSALIHQNRLDEGIAKLEEAVALCPETYGPWEDLATTHHFMGNHDLEVLTYERGVAALPERGNLHRDLANAYHETGQHDKELIAARKASELPTDDATFTARTLARAEAEARGEVANEILEQLDHSGHAH